MRKVLSITLLVSYMLCASGITFSFHHCRGKLKYVNLHPETEKKCCKGKKMPKGCCKDVKVAFKKGDDKSQTFLTFKPKSEAPQFVLTQPAIQCIPVAPYQIAATTKNLLRPPPLRTAGVPLYISYSVYRI